MPAVYSEASDRPVEIVNSICASPSAVDDYRRRFMYSARITRNFGPLRAADVCRYIVYTFSKIVIEDRFSGMIFGKIPRVGLYYCERAATGERSLVI